ncbi:hypothetical protein GUJ93_ZPchr0012g21183 [Zizania palustris]|uniref:Uncharacterized protein n=1 Tax=Zizania palustris TaxID=103762 RepID=A0A8J5WPJ1_ZIZPA|nr:hypothetical protein GUJ93_ZPchr0012g21183 [Zizania palustris]
MVIKCESSFTRMKIIIDSTESDDDTKRVATSGSGTKRVAASGYGTKSAMTSGSGTKRATVASGYDTKHVATHGFGTKWQKATTTSDSNTKLDTVKKMLQYVIEKMHVLEEKIDALIEKGLKK